MTLSELIADLSSRDPQQTVVLAFSTPHSYRGWYEKLAFEIKPSGSDYPETVGDMLACVKGALDKEFLGYKGGVIGWLTKQRFASPVMDVAECL